jgi:hypothetical protein
LVSTWFCWSIMLSANYWKTCRWAYIYVISSSTYSMNLSIYALNYLIFTSSFFACMSCFSISLILAFFSWYLWNKLLRFFFVPVVKVVPMDVMESGSYLTYFFTIVSVRIDNGFPCMTGTFLIFCCTILPVALSNLKFFKFATFLGLYGVQSPKSIPPN